jgi:hypothetical protein
LAWRRIPQSNFTRIEHDFHKSSDAAPYFVHAGRRLQLFLDFVLMHSRLTGLEKAHAK